MHFREHSQTCTKVKRAALCSTRENEVYRINHSHDGFNIRGPCIILHTPFAVQNKVACAVRTGTDEACGRYMRHCLLTNLVTIYSDVTSEPHVQIISTSGITYLKF